MIEIQFRGFGCHEFCIRQTCIFILTGEPRNITCGRDSFLDCCCTKIRAAGTALLMSNKDSHAETFVTLMFHFLDFTQTCRYRQASTGTDVSFCSSSALPFCLFKDLLDDACEFFSFLFCPAIHSSIYFACLFDLIKNKNAYYHLYFQVVWVLSRRFVKILRHGCFSGFRYPQ